MATTSSLRMIPRLSFAGVTEAGRTQALRRGFDLGFTVSDATVDVFLCVGREDNRVRITGTTPKTRLAPVLAAIDELEMWGVPIDLWMVVERDGSVVNQSTKVRHTSHVKPYFGVLTVSGFEADNPKLTYPGIGIGRWLSAPMNGRYYFCYGSRLETDPAMRGFDCTTLPMALLGLQSLPAPGYGKQLCDAAGATNVGLEQLRTEDLKLIFSGARAPFRFGLVAPGAYIIFSEKHVLLYDATQNLLYESNVNIAFKKWRASERELKRPPNDLWWMRKLPAAAMGAFA